MVTAVDSEQFALGDQTDRRLSPCGARNGCWIMHSKILEFVRKLSCLHTTVELNVELWMMATNRK